MALRGSGDRIQANLEHRQSFAVLASLLECSFDGAGHALTGLKRREIDARFSAADLRLLVDKEQHVPSRPAGGVDRIQFDRAIHHVDSGERALDVKYLRLVVRMRLWRRRGEGQHSADPQRKGYS